MARGGLRGARGPQASSLAGRSLALIRLNPGITSDRIAPALDVRAKDISQALWVHVNSGTLRCALDERAGVAGVNAYWITERTPAAPTLRARIIGAIRLGERVASAVISRRIDVDPDVVSVACASMARHKKLKRTRTKAPTRREPRWLYSRLPGDDAVLVPVTVVDPASGYDSAALDAFFNILDHQLRKQRQETL